MCSNEFVLFLVALRGEESGKEKESENQKWVGNNILQTPNQLTRPPYEKVQAINKNFHSRNFQRISFREQESKIT